MLNLEKSGSGCGGSDGGGGGGGGGGDDDGGGGDGRQPIAVSDISVYICLIDIRSKSKEQLNERRAGLSRNNLQ